MKNSYFYLNKTKSIILIIVGICLLLFNLIECSTRRDPTLYKIVNNVGI